MRIVQLHTIPARTQLTNSEQQRKVLSEWAKTQSQYMTSKSTNSVPPVSSYFGGTKYNYIKR